MLSPEGQVALDNEYIIINKTDGSSALYRHSEFIAAFHNAVLDRFTALVPHGSSSRTVQRALRAMHTREEHARVLAAALRTLCLAATPADPTVLADHPLVAAFPSPPT